MCYQGVEGCGQFGEEGIGSVDMAPHCGAAAGARRLRARRGGGDGEEDNLVAFLYLSGLSSHTVWCLWALPEVRWFTCLPVVFSGQFVQALHFWVTSCCVFLWFPVSDSQHRDSQASWVWSPLQLVSLLVQPLQPV